MGKFKFIDFVSRSFLSVLLVLALGPSAWAETFTNLGNGQASANLDEISVVAPAQQNLQIPQLNPGIENSIINQPQQAQQPQAQQQQQGQQGGQAECEEMYKMCVEEEDTNRKACTTQDMQAGLNPAAQAQAQQLMAQGNAANQNVASAGQTQAAQCQNQADLSKILSALSGLKGTACSATVKSCTDTCGQVAKSCKQLAQSQPQKAAIYNARAKVAENKSKVCDSRSSAGTAAMGQMLGLLGSMFQNQACAQQTAAATAAPNDCTNPAYASVTAACICAAVGTNPAADPTNPICQNGQSVAGINPTLSTVGPSTPATMTDMSSDGVAIDGTQAKANTQTGTAAMQGGGSGGGGFGAGGGGMGGLNPGNEGGPAGSSIDKTVITGQSGGGGGLAAGGGGGGGGFGNLGGSRSEGAGKIDLSQWLPKGKYKSLNIGGMSIKPYDGITGPMGPSIWEKVSNQYQLQKTQLIPER